MSNNEVLGIVGPYGDLGQRMAVQANNAFDKVLAYANPGADPVSSMIGIDPELLAVDLSARPDVVNSLDVLVRESSIIHWCAPIAALKNLGAVGEDKIVVLHDSVMSTSSAAERKLLERPNFVGRIIVAHCLMNPEKTVVVNPDGLAVVEAIKHFRDLGLNPTEMLPDEHDYLMAQTQGLFALLIEATPGLDDQKKAGLLTPSGAHFKEARDSRDSIWTQKTKESLFRNPGLKRLVAELATFLEESAADATEILDI